MEAAHEATPVIDKVGSTTREDRYVASPMLRKFDKRQPESASGPPDPLDHRVLSIYSTIYRVEAGAWVRLFIPWLMQWIPAASYGGLPSRQCLDAAWDVQGFLEEWIPGQEDCCSGLTGLLEILRLIWI